MKIFIIILTFILMTSLTWAQSDTVFIKYNNDKFIEKPNYITDTVVFETPNARQILYGTTILPWTYNQQVAKGYGFFLRKIVLTPCKQKLQPILNEDEFKPDLNQVLSVKRTDTLWTIETKINENCCHSFLCDIKIVDDSIIDLIYYSYGATYCDCNCCFGMTYNIEKMNFEDNKKVKYVMINGDRKTIIKL